MTKRSTTDLTRWLAPFLARLRHKARRRMCPLYIEGLVGVGERKSVEPMASRLAPGDYDQLDASIYATAGAVLIGEAQISAPERGVFFR